MGQRDPGLRRELPQEPVAGDDLPPLERVLEAELPAAVALRHELHAGAELSHHEGDTRERLVAFLGGDYERVAGKSLLFGAAVGPRPIVVLRAEMDALPLEEATEVEWASGTGAMHACGHDVHMAALAAAMRALRRLRPPLPVSARALFQHSEESYPSGAEEVVASGALEDAAAVIACHVHPDVPWQAVAADAGPVNAAVDFFTVRVLGAPGHSAYPHQARDAIAALCQIVGNLQQVAARSMDPTHGHVVSIGYIRAGSAPNALPGSAEAGGSLRALDPGDRERMRNLVHEVATGIARAWGCDAEIEITPGEPALVNDSKLAGAVRSRLAQWGFATGGEMRSCGSDDFGFFSTTAPSLMSFVGVGGALAGPDVSLHHPRFLPPDDAVGAVARAYAAALLGAADLYGATNA
jgi:amidohydrolase